MLLLPRGVSLHEDVPANQYDPPALLRALKSTLLTGYVRFRFPGAVVYLVFHEGRLLSALHDSGAGRSNGLAAIASLCERVASDGGRLDVFRLSPELVREVHALLEGRALTEAQELKLIDRKALLEKVKAQQLTGALHISSEDRSALIFYHSGNALGFFHDGSDVLETSASEFQKIAGLAGARMGLWATTPTDLLLQFDLVEMVNVDRVWETTVARHAERIEAAWRETEEKTLRARAGVTSSLAAALADAGAQTLGKMGRQLVEKEVDAAGGPEALLQPAPAEVFLAAVERGGRLLAGATKVRSLVDLLRSAIVSARESVPRAVPGKES